MKTDLARRKRVMQRSVELGHCICDPRRSCPCDVFHDQGICPCAGERPAALDVSQLKLTALVHNPGCASKIAPRDLDAVLVRLPTVQDPAVISGLAAADDAAIYQISENLCLVQTVDVFTPCVDDPELFGRICAANCLSDVYAMGGEPRTALSILAFPSETLDGEAMFLMLKGAMEKLAEAKVALVGGHSIKDPEIKLGFAVTGTINPVVASSLERARPGDALVLTKPLGTGVVAFARQIGRRVAGEEDAQNSMATLNKAAAEAMRAAEASACTDVTGFGFLGHLLRLARQSGLTAEVDAEALPAFPGVMEALRGNVISGAIERNREYVAEDIEVESGLNEAFLNLGCDAQTSGGLLVAVAPERLSRLLRELQQRGQKGWVVGSFTEQLTRRIRFKRAVLSPDTRPRPSPPAPLPFDGRGAIAEQASMPEPQTGVFMPANMDQQAEAHGAGCCADVFGEKKVSGTATDAAQAFAGMMRAVQSGGAVDERSKELILFALVVFSRCAPCFKSHYERALELGLTQAQLDEAAWCAVAMGGAPVRMFYREAMKNALTLTAASKDTKEG
jgi:selenide,water dikinase